MVLYRTGAWISFASILLLWLGCGAHPSEPLSKAAMGGDLAEMTRLITQGASTNERETALVWAARSGQPKAIDLLVKNGADPNVRWGVNDWTVLMHAIHKDQPTSVEALLNRGADVNARVGRGETALMMAAGYGYADIVRMLIDHGADVHAALPNGENALDFAVSGVTDIDRFTLGKCQSEAVRALTEKAPDLRAKDSAKLKRCS